MRGEEQVSGSIEALINVFVIENRCVTLCKHTVKMAVGAHSNNVETKSSQNNALLCVGI